MRSTRRKIKPETTFADEVLHSLGDFAQAVDQGETITVRTVTMDLRPKGYGADDVRRTRTLLNVSQAIFAQLLAVSLKTVPSWEQGQKPPSAIARRLMDDFNEAPERWRAVVRNAKVVASGRKPVAA